MKLDSTNREEVRLELRRLRDVPGIEKTERWRYGALFEALTFTPNPSPWQIDVFNGALANPNLKEVQNLLEEAGFERSDVGLAVLKLGRLLQQ